MSKIKQLIRQAIYEADSVPYSANTEQEKQMCNVLDKITEILLEIEKTYAEMWEYDNEQN